MDRESCLDVLKAYGVETKMLGMIELFGTIHTFHAEQMGIMSSHSMPIVG